MDEQQVRLLVRQAIARHMGALSPTVSSAAAPLIAAPVQRGTTQPPPTAALPVSFARFHLTRPAGETECLIEPDVTCNHCGHCQCYGH